MLCVVLAGGKGTRLWPESTGIRPKQVCNLWGQGSLLALTLDRLRPVGDLMVVCGQEQVDIINNEISNNEVRVLVEPQARSTAPAVGLVLSAGELADNEVVGIFPSDHHITDTAKFIEDIYQAQKLAREGYLVTIGIVPESPETGFGYIEIADGYLVKAFHEKPCLEMAEQYIARGNYYWNSGIFVATAATWRLLIKQYLPELFLPMESGIEKYIGDYSTFPSVSIDYGIAEKCHSMAMVKGNFSWNDIGSWEALARILPQDERGNALTGQAMAFDSTGCLARSSEKQIVLFGLNDLIVVETEDTILVCPKSRSQDVRNIAQLLVDGND